MTVTYTLEVSRARFWGFPKLLARWRGSIYRLMYREMTVFLIAFYVIGIVYRLMLTPHWQRQFERAAIYCREFTSVVPITFVLGFFVSVIVGRWWQQYMAIPWPDRVAMQISAYVQGTDERGRIIRRTMARYLVLISVLTFQNTSTVIKRRFPTMEHLVEGGLLTDEERAEIEDLVTPHGMWWIPAQWFSQLAMIARKEGRIHDDLHLKTLIDEMMDYRGLCGLIFSYDWISVPLVYTQVVTIAVYSFFTACLFGRQYLFDTPQAANSAPGVLNPSGHDIDYYVPIFTIFQFFFYVGWLKVAESMICPFGEDDDDFDLNWIIDRNISVAYTIVDQMHRRNPKLMRDVFWDNQDPLIPYSRAAAHYRRDPFYGSTMNMNISDREAAWHVPSDMPMPPIDEEGMVGMPFGVTSPSKKPRRVSRRAHSQGSKHLNETGISRSSGGKSPDGSDSASENEADGDDDDEGSIASRQLEEKRKRKGLFSLLLGNSRQTLSSRLESRYGSKQSISRSPPPVGRAFSSTSYRGRVGSSILKHSRASSPVISCTQHDEVNKDAEELGTRRDSCPAPPSEIGFHQSPIDADNYVPVPAITPCGTSSTSNIFYDKIDVPPSVREEPEPSDSDQSGSATSNHSTQVEEPISASKATLAHLPTLPTVQEVDSFRIAVSTSSASVAGSSDSSNNSGNVSSSSLLPLSRRIVISKVANGGAEFVKRTEQLLKHAGPKYLAFVGKGIMKPFEIYLFLYNSIQVFGWGAVMIKTFNGLINNESFDKLYENVAFELQIFQTAAVLEIVHAVVGFVRSPVGTTAMQVYSRVFVVWAILYKILSSRFSIGVPMLLVAWSITEVVRYSFYALGLIKCVPYALTWMRYTFFIVLYVMGASGELFTMYASLPEVAEKKHFTVDMPNFANMSFSFYAYLVIIMLTYIPGFPQMYLYMFSQRAKVLGTKVAKKEA